MVIAGLMSFFMFSMQAQAESAGGDGVSPTRKNVENTPVSGSREKDAIKNHVAETPKRWLSNPTNAPSMTNTTEVSKENIDMTCTGMNKCVNFTACLSKNCDSSKQVSQLFAFKSPKSKTVFPKNHNLALVANPNDELCWTPPIVQKLPVRCTLTGPCTTEGAEGGECKLVYGLSPGSDPIDKSEPEFGANGLRQGAGLNEFDKMRGPAPAAAGKATCMRKPAGTCSSGAAVSPPSKCYTEFKLPESVKCYVPNRYKSDGTLGQSSCEVNFDLSQLKGFSEAASSSSQFLVSYRNGDINLGWGEQCNKNLTSLNDLKNGEWSVSNIYKGESRTSDEKAARTAENAVVIKDGKITIIDKFADSHGNYIYPCISAITVFTKNTSDPACNVTTTEPPPVNTDPGDKPLD